MRVAACVLIALLLAAAHPIEARLRAEAPPRPTSAQIGVGPLLGSVLTGTFRPLLLQYLWIRTDTLYGQGRMDELFQNFHTILTLYPNNERARDFLGWHLAFNMKIEESDRELAWRAARDGLDILVEIDAGRPTLAYWFLVQCGQNPAHPDFPMRYAGPDWRDERWWRERARAWGERTYGETLTRFELGLKAIEGRDNFYSLRRRADLAICLAYDQWARSGRCARFDDIVRALRVYMQEVVDNPQLAQALMAELYLIQWLQARDLDRLAKVDLEYRPALALLVIGALDEVLGVEKRMRCLQMAAKAFERLGKDVYAEELEMVTMWQEHVVDPTEKRPPLPFDQ